MRLLFKILSLFFLLVLMTAEDCSNSTSEMTRSEIEKGKYQDIDEEFVGNEITQASLNAYEVRVVQKIKDLSDYVTIYLDNNLEKEFRTQAKDMIYNSFYSYERCHKFFNDLGLKEDTTRILLYNPDISEGIIFRTDSVKISERIEKTNEFEYSGKVSFDAGLFNINENDTILIDRKKLTFPITVTKKEKNFGTGSEKVWEVLLGDS